MNANSLPSRSERFKNIALGVAGIIASVAIPGVGLWLGFIQKNKEVEISAAQKDRELQRSYVELGIRILSDPPRPEAVALRKWAVDLVNANSAIKMSEGAESAVINSVPLTVNPAGRLSVAAYTSIVAGRPLGAALSRFNRGIIDFAALKNAGVKFCFFQATYGVNTTDRTVHTFARQASEVGMPFGLFHSFDVAADGQTQAENFLKVMSDLSPSFPPILDLEETPNQQARPDFAQQVGRFLGRLKSDGKPSCLIYSTKNFLDRYFPNGIDNSPLCLARFATETSTGSLPALPKGWKKATFWHFTDEAPDTRLKGLDLFVFNGTDEQLRDPSQW